MKEGKEILSIFGFWQRLTAKLQNKMLTLSIVLTKPLTLYRQKRTKKKLSKLLNFENLKASLFYRILETQEMSLLNPKNAKVNQNQIEIHWLNVLERYYLEVSPEKYTAFINRMRATARMANEITTLEAIYTLEKIGIKSEEKQKFKIKGDLLTNIKIKKTKFELKKRQFFNEDKKEAKVNYYQLLSDYESILGYSFNPDMKMPEWCGKIKTVKNKSDAQKEIHGRTSKR